MRVLALGAILWTASCSVQDVSNLDIDSSYGTDFEVVKKLDFATKDPKDRDPIILEPPQHLVDALNEAVTQRKEKYYLEKIASEFSKFNSPKAFALISAQLAASHNHEALKTMLMSVPTMFQIFADASSMPLNRSPFSVCIRTFDFACIDALADSAAHGLTWNEFRASFGVNQTVWGAYIDLAMNNWNEKVWFSNGSPKREWENPNRMVTSLFSLVCASNPNEFKARHVMVAIEDRNFAAVKAITQCNPQLISTFVGANQMNALHTALETSGLSIRVSKVLTGHQNHLYHRQDLGIPQSTIQAPEFDSLDHIGLAKARRALADFNATAHRDILDRELLTWNNRFVELFLENHLVAPTATDDFGNTYLHIAAKNGNAAAIKLILEAFPNQLDLEARNQEGHTAMSFAQVYNQYEVQILLYRYKAIGVDLDYYGNQGCSSASEHICLRGHSAPVTKTTKPAQPVPANDWNPKIDPRVDITYCDLDVRENITVEEFQREYVFRRRPVVLRDPSIFQWPVFTNLSQARLKTDFRDGVFRIYEKMGVERPLSFQMEIGEFMKYLESESGEDEMPLWLVDTRWPEAYESEFAGMFGEFDLVTEGVSTTGGSIRVHNFQFMIAPVLSGSSIHYHFSAVNLLVFGRKRWFLWPPNQAFYSTLHIYDWFKLIYPTLSNSEKPLECIQEPGDVIFLPEGWGHGTISSQDSVGYAQLYTN